MSDTMTDEQVGDEAPEATPQPDAPAETPAEGEGEGTTSEPAAPAEPEVPKPTTEELVAVLVSTFDTALGSAQPDGSIVETDGAALQAAYRAVPAAKRGQVQAEILRAKISDPGANHQAIASLLEIMTQAPTTKTRAPKAAVPEVPAHVTLALQINALDVARLALVEGVDAEVLTEALNLSEAQLQGGFSGDTAEANTSFVTTAAAKIVKAVSVKARKASAGTGGPRNTKTETIANLVERGSLPAGSELKHGDLVATVTSDGKLKVGETVVENPTAAAKAAGVTSSVNGWDYWQFSGKPVGDLRQA